MPDIRSVLGPIDRDGLGTLLTAESLLRHPLPLRGNAGLPATEAEFERRAVDMSMLGRLTMGAANLDDRTLRPADAEAALRCFAAACDEASVGGAGAVVALAPVPGAVESVQDAASFVALSGATGIAIIRGANGAGEYASGRVRAGTVRAAILADLGGERVVGDRVLDGPAAPDPGIGRAGVVGLVPGDDEAALSEAAEAAAEAGVALVLAPTASLSELERALDRLECAGLDRSRVIATGASGLVAGTAATGDRRSQATVESGASGGPQTSASSAPRLGVDAPVLDALLDLGAHVCFDDLGRIPNVRTVVSDHDVALAILHCAERGMSDRILLSSGIREKHRLTAFGGNGLEFVPQQFLPYLRMCGASEELVRAVGGGNAARALTVAPSDGTAEVAVAPRSCGTFREGVTK